MKNEDLFDLEDLSDLPEDLRPAQRDTKIKRMLKLFEIANKPLSNEQLAVGYYRKYGEKLKRGSMSAFLHYMARQTKAVKNVRRGVWELNKDA